MAISRLNRLAENFLGKYNPVLPNQGKPLEFFQNRHLGIDLDAGGRFGISIDPSQDEALMDRYADQMPASGSVLEVVLQSVYSAAQTYPNIIQTFLRTFESRKITPGFPEQVMGERALESVIETIFKGPPTHMALEAIRAGDSADASDRHRDRSAFDEIDTYVDNCLGILSRLYFTHGIALDMFIRNARREREDMARYVGALHLSYVQYDNYAPF